VCTCMCACVCVCVCMRVIRWKTRRRRRRRRTTTMMRPWVCIRSISTVSSPLGQHLQGAAPLGPAAHHPGRVYARHEAAGDAGPHRPERLKKKRRKKPHTLNYSHSTSTLLLAIQSKSSPNKASPWVKWDILLLLFSIPLPTCFAY